MYIPEIFNETDKSKIIDLIESYSFGTLITFADYKPVANHIPFLVERNSKLKLIGHVAKSNEQWKHFEKNKTVLAVFQGPNSYISPSWYESAGVPTWNYAAVHIYGEPKIVCDRSFLTNVVNKLTEKHEKYYEVPWSPEYRDNFLDSIVGFEIEVDEIQAKYKLSQNRSKNDRKNIILKLENNGSENSLGVAKLMKEQEF